MRGWEIQLYVPRNRCPLSTGPYYQSIDLGVCADDEWSDASCEASPLPPLHLGVLKHASDDLNGWHQDPSRLTSKPTAKSVTATPADKQVVGVPFDTGGPEHKHRAPLSRPLPRGAWRTPRDNAADTPPQGRLQPMRQPKFDNVEVEPGDSEVAQPSKGGATVRGKYDTVLDNGAHKFEFEILHDGAATARSARAGSGLNRLVVAD